MKFQPKRFVVEVKRGTSRAAFASPDPSPDRFISAEAMLFGEGPKTDRKVQQPALSDGQVPGGRVLRSLVEPPPPSVEELSPPVRRGRKPGSKNKPKIHLVSSEPDSIVEPPRRGRKPGSKNKPKLPSTAVASPDSLDHHGTAAMRSYGFADDGATGQDEPAPRSSAPLQADRAAIATSDSADQGGRETGAKRLRPRLRDRSTILKRYVLDLEPRAGQSGALRARRLARAAR